MSAVQQCLQQLQADFTLSAAQLAAIIDAFLYDMEEGINGRPSSLAMLPSFLTKPDGSEKGVFLALDFGGTNVRVLLAELAGKGRYTILGRHNVLLADPVTGYDYTSSSATAADLFGFLADQLALIASPNKTYLLGHTFSFPCRQTGVNESFLLYWTKEIQTTGVEGQNIAELLRQALSSRSLFHIHPVVIANDTVSALMAAAYQDACADIGSICGTGHNTCYLEPSGHSQPMYINIEAGNFDKLSGNRYDNLLDKASSRPGAAVLEKCCAGRYIGELLRLVLVDMIQEKVLFSGSCPLFLRNEHSLTGKDVAVLQYAADKPDQTAAWLASHNCHLISTADDQQLLQTAAKLIAGRSARLAAATYAAVLKRIDPSLDHRHTIAIDGSLYEKLPGYAGAVAAALQELLGSKSEQVKCILAKDGSGIGAAIAAATTQATTHSRVRRTVPVAHT